MIASTTAPVSIWKPVATRGWRGRSARCVANREPEDHAIGEMRMASRPAPSSAPVAPTAVGPARMPTPTKPTTMPITAMRGSRSPKKARPKIATHTGIIPMRSAAMPDGIVCSPHATPPMPPPSSSPPTIVESRSSRRVGQRSAARSRRPTHVRSRRPASPKRAAAMRNGGSVSTATAIARYVDPHTV